MGVGPLVTAKRAASPSEEGWREVRREERIAMHGSLPLSEKTMLGQQKRHW